MYDVSFSIVTYNNEDIIENTVGSIVSHIENKLDYIIYIIDNHSSDKTVERVKKCRGNIVLIQNDKNLGFGAGHNIALQSLGSECPDAESHSESSYSGHCSGRHSEYPDSGCPSRYHIAANPDITIVNDVISDMVRYMDEHKDIGLLTPLIKYPDGQIQYLCKRNPTVTDLFIRLAFPNGFKKRQDYFTMKETGYNKPFDVEYATGCFMFFRAPILKQLKGFDEHIFLYLEDADITRRVNRISRTVFYPYNYVVHEWQRGAHKSLKLMWINVKSAAWYFWKWR